MPRKKSVQRAADDFVVEADDILAFLEDIGELDDGYVSWCHEYAIIRLYREFERLVLEALIGAINNDTAVLSEKTGFAFPKHLTDEVCEYLVVGNGYFDFKGRDGLIKTLKKYVTDTHYLVVAVKKPEYREALELLVAMRNYAAHESDQSYRTALAATGQERIGSAGSWLKRQGRFDELAEDLKELANEIRAGAPY